VREPGELRINRSDIGTGAVSLQPKKFGRPQSKTRETITRVTFQAADAPTPVTHNLGFVPSAATALNAFRGAGGAFAAPGIVYHDEPLPADKRVVVLKCTVAGTKADILIR
jgi:hypothetical protein